MEKRTILAIVLSAAVLFIYSAIVSNVYHIENKEDTSKKALPAVSEKLSPAKPTAVSAQPTTQHLPVQEYIEFENTKLKIVFANPGAYISRVELKEYNAQFFLQNLLFAADETNYNFKVTRTPETLIFTYRDANREIIKHFYIPNNSYSIELERRVRNLNTEMPAQKYQVFLTSKIAKQSNYENNFMELSISGQEKILRKKLLGLKPGMQFAGGFGWIGLRDRYFTFLVKPYNPAESAFVGAAGQEDISIGLELMPSSPYSLDTMSYADKFTIYLGPQDREKLAALNLGFENIIHFGLFDGIIKLLFPALLPVLRFFFAFTRNWGLAIVLFGVFIYFILYPLTLKQMRSMKELQILQPKIKELQQRYKDNPQKLNKEMMELYKKHKVNPLGGCAGGCLPMLLQMPVFITLFQGLPRLLELKSAGFLWIKDLSQPDRFLMLNGFEINLLPILWAGSMFVQQKFSTAAMSGGSTEQQKMMTIIMPLFIGILLYRLPSSLMLYWFVYGVLTSVKQGISVRKARMQAS